MRNCEVLQAGRMSYGDALALQQRLVEQRKAGEIPDQLLFVEHPHTITMGRNGRMENLLAGEDVLRNAGVEFHSTNRGGDVTYHGPGQIVCYPVFDLKEWKRDVVQYVRTLEAVIIGALAEFGLRGESVEGATGVWVAGAKVAAIGIHITRWITYHGLALNVTTDLGYFRYIVPCGLTKPVTSMAALGCSAPAADVQAALVREFSVHFGLRILQKELQPA